AAVLAGRGHHAAGAVAAAAGAGHAEESLLERDLAPAAARRARAGRGAGRGPAALAGRARLGARDLDVGLGAEDRFLEAEVEVVAQVGAASRASTPAAERVAEAEEVAQDVPEVREDRGIEAGRSAEPGVAVGIVALPLLGVAEDAVRLRGLLEPVLGFLVAGVPVGMVLERQLPVGRLDLGIRRVPRHPEDLVIFACSSHFQQRESIRQCVRRDTAAAWAPATSGLPGAAALNESGDTAARRVTRVAGAGWAAITASAWPGR